MLRRLDITGIGLVVMALFWLNPACLAQSQKNAVPTPLTPSAPEHLSNPDENAVIPYAAPEAQGILDWRPLTGVQKLTLGVTPSSHSFLLPSISVVTQVQSNPYSTGQYSRSTVGSSTYLTGRVALNRISQGSAVLLDYLAGGSFSADFGQTNSLIQSLDFSSTLARGRWSLMAGDQFSYLSQSPFGFGGLGGLSGFGVGLGTGGVGTSPGFNAGVAPDQTIFLNGQRQVMNTVVSQVGYELSHRSMVTFAGTYGLLNFFDSGLQNGSTASFSSGYNYLLSRKDTVGLSYNYGMFMFAGNAPGISTHTALLSYARRVTGRLSFQIGAGLQIQFFDRPLAGTQRVMGWTASTSTSYQYGSFSANLTYSHGLSGGSGVFLGSKTDTVQGTLNRAVSQHWDTSASIGYSRNQTLEQTTTRLTPFAPQTWYGTARLGRRFLAYGSLFFAYTISKQSSLSSVCPLPSCQIGTITHGGSIGYTWGLRPILLR